MRPRRREANRQRLLEVLECDRRQTPGVRVAPKEDRPNAPDPKLQGGDGHWETCSAASGLQGELVCDVVVVVAKVPEGEVDQQDYVDAAFLLRRSRCRPGPQWRKL